jgi:DNA (cytosine-5)-methyltransferase 1
MFRLIRECRPAWVVGENVAGLIKLGLDEVLSDLEGEGYATRTFNLPACAVGAPHIRQRLWIIAHADSQGEPDKPFDDGAGSGQLGFGFVADTDNADRRRGTERRQVGDGELELHGEERPANRPEDYWQSEPAVGRLADGIPNRVSQLRALGNTIIPQIAEEIGHAIVAATKG